MICNGRHHWFGWGESGAGGPIWGRTGVNAICWASPRSVGEGIGTSAWLYWELSCPATATVLCPSFMQISGVLPQGMTIAAWICWLRLSGCRCWEFSTRLLTDSRLGHRVNWSPGPDWWCGELAGAVRESLPYLCGTHLLSPCIIWG